MKVDTGGDEITIYAWYLEAIRIRKKSKWSGALDIFDVDNTKWQEVATKKRFSAEFRPVNDQQQFLKLRKWKLSIWMDWKGRDLNVYLKKNTQKNVK